MRTDTKVQHTPTPWKWEGNRPSGYLLMGPDGSLGEVYIFGEPKNCNARANAAFIVRAVNSHEEFKEVAMYARALLKALEPRFMRTGCSDTEQVAVKCLREAIAKAEGL